MPCNHPLRAFQKASGAPVSFSEPVGLANVLELPCGRCRGCRMDYSRDWAVRCVHEAQMHEHSEFVTLTYDDAHLPGALSLQYRDFQMFMRRLRKALAVPIRFFMCGEYGEQNSRPHYHACLFGVRFPDRRYVSRSPSGADLYESAMLESLWACGRATTGDVNFQSAAYIARYVLKKEFGRDRGRRREILDVCTGEVISRPHEFCQMSLKLGLGARWLEKYFADVYPHGSVVMEGREVSPPRYYDLRFEAVDPVGFAMLRARRQAKASERFDDNSPSRLRAKETVLKARMGFLKREV